METALNFVVLLTKLLWFFTSTLRATPTTLLKSPPLALYSLEMRLLGLILSLKIKEPTLTSSTLGLNLKHPSTLPLASWIKPFFQLQKFATWSKENTLPQLMHLSFVSLLPTSLGTMQPLCLNIAPDSTPKSKTC
jgi:hypothetical protein